MPRNCELTVHCGYTVGFRRTWWNLKMGPCARMCQTHQGRDSPPPDFAKTRCQKVGKSEMGRILVLGRGPCRRRRHRPLLSCHIESRRTRVTRPPQRLLRTRQRRPQCLPPAHRLPRAGAEERRQRAPLQPQRIACPPARITFFLKLS